ncbi:MAG: hypothetical protein WDN28_15405 [Chthoniobacter sp.]
MPTTPVIDPESSILSYPQWLPWEHQFSATNLPVSWAINSGSFPSGMTFEPRWDVTLSDSGDVVNLAAHGFANGTLLVFSAIPSGGGGLSVGTRYYVVNAAADTFQLAAAPRRRGDCHYQRCGDGHALSPWLSLRFRHTARHFHGASHGDKCRSHDERGAALHHRHRGCRRRA